MLRRPNLGIPAPEVDERLPLERSVQGNLRQQRREVLLGETFDPVRRSPLRGDRRLICFPVADPSLETETRTF